MRFAISLLITAAAAGVSGWLCGVPEQRKADLHSPAQAAAKTGAGIKPPPPVKVSHLDAAAVQARLESLLATPGRSSIELRLLMVQWVATDLEAAKKWALALPNGNGGFNDPPSQLLTEFFKAWANLDPLAALAEASVLKGGSKVSTALRAVVAGLAEADAATIGQVLAKLPRGPDNWEPYGVHALAKQLAARDPAAAQALALSLKGAAGDAAARAVAEVLARTDPQAALAWAAAHPLDSARTVAAEAVLKEWARRDPAAVGPLLLQKTEGKPDVFLAEAAVAALKTLSARSPQEVAAFVEKFLPPEQVQAHLGTLYSLLGSNPESPGTAAALCACVARVSLEPIMQPKLFPRGHPSYEGLRPAWDRLMAEPDSLARRFLLSQMGQTLITQRPAQVMQELMKLPDPALREELLTAALNGTGSFDSSGSNDYEAHMAELRSTVAALPEGLRARGSLRLAWRVAESDPRAAAVIIQEHPSVAEDVQFMQHLSSHFIRTADPVAAQSWADSLPGDTAKSNAYAGITSAWYIQDSEAVSQWVNTLPPGSARDAAAAQLAHTGTRHNEPDTALAWAASVQDPARRAGATADVVSYWAKFNPSLAEEIVTGSTLSGPEKADLLRIVNQNR